MIHVTEMCYLRLKTTPLSIYKCQADLTCGAREIKKACTSLLPLARPYPLFSSHSPLSPAQWRPPASDARQRRPLSLSHASSLPLPSSARGRLDWHLGTVRSGATPSSPTVGGDWIRCHPSLLASPFLSSPRRQRCPSSPPLPTSTPGSRIRHHPTSLPLPTGAATPLLPFSLVLVDG